MRKEDVYEGNVYYLYPRGKGGRKEEVKVIKKGRMRVLVLVKNLERYVNYSSLHIC